MGVARTELAQLLRNGCCARAALVMVEGVGVVAHVGHVGDQGRGVARDALLVPSRHHDAWVDGQGCRELVGCGLLVTHGVARACSIALRASSGRSQASKACANHICDSALLRAARLASASASARSGGPKASACPKA